MGTSNSSSIFRRKISAINDVIDSGDFYSALSQLEQIEPQPSAADYQSKAVNYLRLKTLNRLQWLVEADAVAKVFSERADLDSREYLELALFYVLTASLKQAEHYMRCAIEQDKRSQLLASEMAILLEQQGKSDRAAAIYKKILAAQLKKKTIDEVGSRVLYRLAGLTELEEGQIQRIASICEKHAGEDLEIRLLFGLAKGYAKSGDTANEIKCLLRANRLADESNESQPQSQTVKASQLRVRAIKTLFEVSEPDWMPDYFTCATSPIFVLGMPRSGTTLLEQILGAHSSVGNSGESRAMGIAFQRQLAGKSLLPEDEGAALPFFRYKALGYEDSKAIVSYYNQYQSLLSDKAIVTDKELSNIDRVGLIIKMYPNAKFVGIRRHPLDMCVSVMQHDFAGAYFSASSLKIVQESELYYEKLEHWQKLYPASVMLLEYEELVSGFEKTVSNLLEFLKLPWEDPVLQFHRRQNSVRTPSLSQVRSAINTRSVNKFEKYRELIQPAEQYLLSRCEPGHVGKEVR